MGFDWSNLLAILLAIGLGGAIGFERQMSGKAAGLRTNTLICLGAAMFTLISKQLAGPSDSGTQIAHVRQLKVRNYFLIKDLAFFFRFSTNVFLS